VSGVSIWTSNCKNRSNSGRLPVEMPFDQPGRGDPFASIFQESKPHQGSQNASLHGAGPEIPCRLQYADNRHRAEARECFSIQPIVRRYGKRLKNNTHIALRPKIEQASVEIRKVHVPERNMEKNGLQSAILFFGNDALTQPCRHQLSAMCSDQPGRLHQYVDEMEG
jgi:hypothetical protein